jgi:hypothetical protein
MGEMVEVFGAISLTVIGAAFFSGLFMKYRRKTLFKIHRAIGYIAFGLAICHSILAMID